MAGSDSVRVRVGSTSDAVAADRTLERVAGVTGAEIATTDDRTAGVGDVRGWVADPDGLSFLVQQAAEPRGIWATPGDLDRLLAAQNALIFKGVIDCSANPNYPAADAGALYRVSVAGLLGGASGVHVEPGDEALCLADSTAAGDQGTVGADWNVTQANIDGAVIGPASATNGNLPTYSGSTGKVIQDSGKSLPSGSVVGTTDSQALTHKDLTDATNTFPSFPESQITGLVSDLGAKQPLDSDLTTIAGLTATTDNFLVAVASAWASRTPSQVRTTLGLVIGTNVQAWDADLDTWATKTPPSGTPVGDTDTQTLTNKRRTPRVVTVSSSATPTLNTDTADVAKLYSLATNVTSMTTNLSGTPTSAQSLLLKIKDDGTGRTIAWGTSFASSGVATLLATTVAGKVHVVGFLYDIDISKWVCMAVDAVGY